MKTYDSLRTELLTEEYLPLCEELRHYLEEKLLVIGKGAKYGQAVILAGGAGSGKSFAAANLMQGDMFKIYNPDDIKSALLKMRDNVNNAATDALSHPLPPLSEPMKKNIEKIQGLNMLDPRDTGTLHKLIKNMKKDAVGKEWDKDANKFVDRVHKDMSIDQRRMMYAFFGERGRTELPNVMFDITLKDIGALHNDLSGELGVLDFLKGAGYKPENIHIVWILTDYRIAMQQNLTRDRVVAADILFQTHRGASATMQDILFRNYGSLGINGEITVVMGGKNGGNVEYKKGMTYEKDGKSYVIDRDVNVPVFKEIKYYRVKLAGQRGINSEALKAIMNEIKKKAPGARATPEKTLSQAIKRIGAKKRGAKIDPITANALDIPLSNPAVRKRK
jgi:hypothetical protein